MESLSAYQQMRRANLTENSQFLMQYGLQAPVVENISVTRVEEKEVKQKVASKRAKAVSSAKQKIPDEERRTSFRIRLKVQHDYFEEYEPLKDSDDDEEELLKNLSQPNRNIARPPRPNSYGSIEGVKVGTWWETRLDCNYDYIHRPTVAGIHQGPDGAYSVALSGGYEDDVDLGDFFTYTGEGGRDLKGTANNPKNLRTAPQSKHQTLTRGNLALARNVETGNPVRVIRGYKLRSKFAPERGYRYDGLYNVTKYWETVGKAGYKIFKYEFQRCDPEPAPWHEKGNSPPKDESDKTTKSHEMEESCYETPTKATDNLSSNPNKSANKSLKKSEDSRKTLYFEITPGKKSPLKVPSQYEDVANISVTCENVGWPGWPCQSYLPKNPCLSLKCGNAIEQVCLVGDQWCSIADVTNLPLEQCTRRSLGKDTFQEMDGSPCTLPVVLGAEDTQPSVFNEVNCSNQSQVYTDDNWCGWSQEDFAKLECLTVSYGGCAVRICEKGGKWCEVNGNDVFAVDEYDGTKDSCPDVSVDACDWLGWPEREFSVLDCPSTFNCVLSKGV